ncbi:hypothetical protein BDW02DRAFT_567745 [Decorospora gaudefroyi]|uniref:Uncharacterized protein n=1 Tax=Decorospora gaudefroyi TaxID=184978 RepID=A0A6A5KEP1_9PLEO|nr:hypothetical protein BDW02DRAFT_567745 [Decorospora gaudefroyi]
MSAYPPYPNTTLATDSPETLLNVTLPTGTAASPSMSAPMFTEVPPPYSHVS